MHTYTEVLFDLLVITQVSRVAAGILPEEPGALIFFHNPQLLPNVVDILDAFGGQLSQGRDPTPLLGCCCGGHYWITLDEVLTKGGLLLWVKDPGMEL
jgi:hypothetical protein